MEFKDTVINPEEIGKLITKWNDINSKEMAYATNARPSLEDMLSDISRKQAEISFKAGQEVGFNEGVAKTMDAAESTHGAVIDNARQAGIREAVEFIKRGRFYNEIGGVVSVDFMPGEWQAKLKEWGIEQLIDSGEKE